MTRREPSDHDDPVPSEPSGLGFSTRAIRAASRDPEALTVTGMGRHAVASVGTN